MDYKDYYQTMGVARDASADVIKRAYRKLARKYHPDVSKEAHAEEKFKALQEAYEVLKDPEKRAAYDQLGANWRAGQEFRPPPDWGRDFQFATGGGADDAGFSDFFASLFGAGASFGRAGRPGRRGFRRTGDDQVAAIDITVDEAFHGSTRTLEIKAPRAGPDGRIHLEPRTLRVTIPAGVTSGQRIRLAGQGNPGREGGPPGDLYLEISIAPHPAFRIEGRNVMLTLPVAPWEAALGATVPVPTLGGKVDMRIPKGAQTDQRLRLKGRGLPGQPPGDQIVALRIVLPPADTPQARAFYERMQQELRFDPRSGPEPG